MKDVLTGAELREMRLQAGRSLGQVAGFAGCTRGHLSRVEKGERPPTPTIQLGYERACRKVAATPSVTSGPTLDDMRRRAFLSQLGAASVGGMAVEPLVRILDQLPSGLPARVGAADVTAIVDTMDHFTKVDLRSGGGFATHVTRGYIDWVLALLKGDMGDRIREQLHPAVAALVDRLAWAHYDTGALDFASELFNLALSTISNGPDRTLRAHILLNLSTVTYDRGMRADAVNVLRNMALGDERVSLTERANLHAVCARHLGGLGDRQAAMRHLGQAEEALGQADPSQSAEPWARRVIAEPGHFDSALGLAHFANGNFDQAAARFTAALSVLSPNRARTAARCQTRLAVIRIKGGDPDVGETIARQALAAGKEVRSARVAADLRMVETTARQYGLTALAQDLQRELVAS